MKQVLKGSIGNKFDRTLVKRLGQKNSKQLWMILQRNKAEVISDEMNLLINKSDKSKNEGR